MRENDDDAPVTEPQGSLVDGLGETAGSGDYETSGDPYGDVDFDDSYGEDDDGSSVDGPFGDADDTGGDDLDDTYDTTDPSETDGTYGDGDASSGTDDVDDVDDGLDDVDATVGDGASTGGDEAFVAQDSSPLEGIGFLIDEVREALFGDDDAAAASPFDTDPVDLETDTDLDLTGDGLVDRADLHEAASSFDFRVGDGGHGHHDHHDDGVIDA